MAKNNPNFRHIIPRTSVLTKDERYALREPRAWIVIKNLFISNQKQKELIGFLNRDIELIKPYYSEVIPQFVKDEDISRIKIRKTKKLARSTIRYSLDKLQKANIITKKAWGRYTIYSLQKRALFSLFVRTFVSTNLFHYLEDFYSTKKKYNAFLNKIKEDEIIIKKGLERVISSNEAFELFNDILGYCLMGMFQSIKKRFSLNPILWRVFPEDVPNLYNLFNKIGARLTYLGIKLSIDIEHYRKEQISRLVTEPKITKLETDLVELDEKGLPIPRELREETKRELQKIKKEISMQEAILIKRINDSDFMFFLYQFGGLTDDPVLERNSEKAWYFIKKSIS